MTVAHTCKHGAPVWHSRERERLIHWKPRPTAVRMCATPVGEILVFFSFIPRPPPRPFSPFVAVPRDPASRALRKGRENRSRHSSRVPFSAVIYSSFMNPLLRPPLSPLRVPSSFSLLPFFIRDCSAPVNPSYLPFSAFLSARVYTNSLPPLSLSLPSSRTLPPRVLSNLSCQAFISSITDFFQVANTCCTGTIDIMISAITLQKHAVVVKSGRGGGRARRSDDLFLRPLSASV